MSTISFGSHESQSHGLLPAETSTRAGVAFVAFVSLLTILAFISPIGDYWYRSTYDAYVNADRMETGERDGSMARKIALGSLGLFGLAAIMWPGGKTLRVPDVLGVLCLAYLAWCAASFLWSDAPATTSRRWIALACEVVAGLAIAKRTSVRQFVWIVLICSLAWVCLGVVAELTQGTFRPWQQGYRFAGIFHPNQMGENAAILTLSSLYLATGARRQNRALFALAAFGFIVLLLTGSRTALGATVVSIAALWFMMAPRPRVLFRALVGGIAAACVALAIGVGIIEFTTGSLTMGREDHDVSSLTSRVPLWQELLEFYASEKPLTGSGYGAFWTDDRIAEVSDSQTWALSTAHSMYIDLVLNVGYIGAALCLSAMVLAFIRLSRLEQQKAKAGYGFIAMIVVFALASGLLETSVGVTYAFSFLGICGVCYLMFDDEDSRRDPAGREPLRFGLQPLTRHGEATA